MSDALPLPDETPRIRARIGTREALRFLMETGAMLASSLDYQATLRTVASLAVPRIACFCLVDVVEDGGERMRRVAFSHIDPAREESLRREVAGSDEAPDGPFQEVLRTGEPLLVERVTEEWLREARTSAEGMELLRRLAPTSFIVAPLVARGHRLGVVGLGSTRTDRFYGDGDLALARELARIAALSIDNALLYERAQRAVRAREEVLGIVSHDLRNPVATISMAADSLLEMVPPEGDRRAERRHLEIIRRSADRVARLIQDLMDVTRMESGRIPLDLRPTDVHSLLVEAQEMLEPVVAGASLTLECRVEAGLPKVRADRHRVLQVISNLVGNAVKFTAAGGTVTLAAERGEEEGEVRCVVADTGKGIPPEQLPHLFDRFWQADRTDRRGIGLGLAIVQGIVAAHEGRVWVESVVGEGSRFCFTLPVAEVPDA
ncbi:MAG: GAF domain-containing sensor histidine kinase [Gemmatimonadetes bacterium]|nr:GAF domain-containing sensor histidine kinase [Gemmatimonadota bacterium]